MNHHQQQDEWDQESLQSRTAANPHSWARTITTTVKQHWQPEPLALPVVDVDLPHLTAFERSAEVLRFMLSRFEFWLSPNGALREFLKLNIRVAIAVAIPVLMVAPFVTMALTQFKVWIDLLSQSMSSFVLFPLSVILSIILVSGLVYIGRSILEMRMRYQRRDPYY